MENIKLLFKLFFRPASAMSEIIDKGNWFFAAILVLLVSVACFVTINSTLHTTYAVPDFYQYSQPEVAAELSVAEADAYYNRAQVVFQKVMAEREILPLVGDNFFRFFS